MQKNAWKAPKGRNDRSYGHLPLEFIKEWATAEADCSEAYSEGRIGGTSTTEDGKKRKAAMLKRIERALNTRSNFTKKQIAARMKEISNHLEDPGLLMNFEFFEIPTSDFMLQFYFAVWDRRIAEVMCYLHNYGKDLKGVVRKVPAGDVWYQMSYYEGMNINERKKAANVVKFINDKDIKRATSFGGGNIPERLYDLPHDLELTVFDDGPVSPLEELFPDENQRNKVNYIHESLANATKHPELFNTQELVWMHGVSMYLDEAKKHQMTGAILSGIALMAPEGYMKYDYLLWTESMRRVIKTQNWPYDPRNPMVIFDTVDDVLKEARKTINAVNGALGGKAYVEVLDPEITFTEPWGVTSVRFTIQKHVESQ
ncbi:hypothetical protein IKE19_00865 [Candidatus Saccharibacteria bacterium]|nr:hypothetical protein [Candidatus Saccharibacteria bacterium]